MKNKLCIRLTAFIFAFLFLFSVLAVAIAANTVVPKSIATSDIMDDLKSMEAYDTTRYNMDETVDYCEILELIEFGYDASGNTREYGLYLYIYNPSGKVIETASAFNNRVQLRAARTKETVSGGDTKWYKYSLKYLDKSSDNLFYKFKIDVPNAFMREVDKNLRIYEIADVELFFEDEDKIRSVGASGKWMYTGYQEYHAEGGKNEKSTLSWESDVLMTLDLELQHSTFKTDTHQNGYGWQYELASVYFAVPNKIIRDYGDPDDVTKGLVEIAGSYDKYTYNGISTQHNDVYDVFSKYANKDVRKDDIPVGFITSPYEYSFGTAYGKVYFTFNHKKFFFVNETFYIDPLYALNSYDNVFSGTANGISQSSLEAQILSKLEQDFFVAEKETVPYIISAIKDDENYLDLSSQIITYSDKHGSYGFWDFFILNYSYDDESYSDIEPIVAVDYDYIKKWDDDKCGEHYFISEEDSSAFCDFVKNNNSKSTTFILRYAATDYYCSDIEILHENSDHAMGIVYPFDSGNYYFRKTSYLDFDVLSLTWRNKNGVRTVIPVKASPINIVGNVTPSHKDNGNSGNNNDSDLWDCVTSLADLRWQVLMTGFVVIIVIIFMFPGIGKLFGKFFGLIGRFFGWLFRLPGKMLDGEKKLDERRARKRKLSADKEDRKYKNEERERERQEREEKAEKKTEEKAEKKTEEKSEEKT